MVKKLIVLFILASIITITVIPCFTPASTDTNNRLSAENPIEQQKGIVLDYNIEKCNFLPYSRFLNKNKVLIAPEKYKQSMIEEIKRTTLGKYYKNGVLNYCKDIENVEFIEDILLESKELVINDISNEGPLNYDIIRYLSNLEKLKIERGMDNEEDKILLEEIKKLKNLKYLDISNFSFKDTKEVTKILSSMKQLEGLHFSLTIDDYTFLESLPNLKALDISGNHNYDLTSIGKLTQLKELKINNLNSHESHGHKSLDLTPLSSLTQLEYLDISNTYTDDITPLASLANLEYLDISGTCVNDITPLAGLKKLKHLKVSDMLKFNEFNKVYDSREINLAPLAQIQNLKSLRLGYIDLPENIRIISRLSELEQLSVYEKGIDIWSELKNFKKLRVLDYHCTGSLELDFSFAEKLSNLEVLDLSNTLKDILEIKKLKKLRALEYSVYNDDCEPVTSDFFYGFEKLEVLYLNYPIDGLLGLEKCKELKILYIDENAPYKNVNPTFLKGLSRLEMVRMPQQGIDDLSLFENCPHLKYLHLFGGGNITDLSPLTVTSKLENLSLCDNKIKDLSPLAGLYNLKTLILNNNQITDLTPLKPLLSSNHGVVLFLEDNFISDISPAVGVFYTYYNGNYSANDEEYIEYIENVDNVFIHRKFLEYDRSSLLDNPLRYKKHNIFPVPVFPLFNE